jgi:16S rRNA (adenine1518-N6/adenine1519-N6)-dimethyltransferase
MAWQLTGTQVGLTSTFSRPDPSRRGKRPARAGRPYRPRELRDAGVSPSKALGQHFLTDYAYVNRIVAGADLGPGDTVIEIGPGLGVLTERLAGAAGRVIAVELDSELASRLRERAPANVTVVEGDALDVEPQQLLDAAGLAADAPYALAGNLPYNVGTAIVRRFLEAGHPPLRIVVMLQKEVADAMTASAGELSLLGVSVQVYAHARKLFNVPPRAFYPPPRVTSGVIRLDLRETPLIAPEERERFFRVVRAGFSAPRKQLRNTLAQGLGMPPAEVAGAIRAEGLQPELRPQQLRVEDWLRLARRLGGAT